MKEGILILDFCSYSLKKASIRKKATVCCQQAGWRVAVWRREATALTQRHSELMGKYNKWAFCS